MKTLFNQHGGKIDSAVASYGGKKTEWLDLSTGINPISYPLSKFKKNVWEALPDDETFRNVLSAAKLFWDVPTSSSILCSSGASALIALIPFLYAYRTVTIEGPTYSEHEASFRNAGFSLIPKDGDVQIVVNPNNPDGRLHLKNKVIKNHRKLTIIDESFCDPTQENSLAILTKKPGFIVLKSFGKFWGLGGVRLGFAVGTKETLDPIKKALGPWQVSGPALAIGTQALNDLDWAAETRLKLIDLSARLDKLMKNHQLIGGTNLFRLYSVSDATAFAQYLASAKILTRTFNYNRNWIRFGLPKKESDWKRIQKVLN